MASTCISNCITDTRVPIRPTYVNLYKWPESDAEFVRSLSSDGRSGGGGRVRSTVVDSISCRQMYLRSYTFHRNEAGPEKTKCFGRVKKERRKRNKSKKKRMALRRAKEVSFAALLAMFRRLLSCTTKVDVADHGG
ncbi:hypothetical protein E1A91_D08G002700v1 [Gossypium mustelinum]|uniref:Uncharacterized protein n=5 Tax=Gossypium TaxID=3633 RepID=A0A0D2MRN2_GOSRA|nr:uncharacterized protein LOC105789956 [Gossypium raimondii]KAA3471759.1 Sulfate transporter 1.2 [Gossypium australe]MBA0609785.1 hypothetical protein [Gossypium davidsonii]MBA0644848.1 hypothetical protein [Gossypium klotzschianum]TYI67235.1 hypothetical protein E1A91_D08G002700v1 [Gossypium mustelinum]KJB21612.1 hypothetical protein B456_004G003100 [Gossypium raimondii]